MRLQIIHQSNCSYPIVRQNYYLWTKKFQVPPRAFGAMCVLPVRQLPQRPAGPRKHLANVRQMGVQCLTTWTSITDQDVTTSTRTYGEENLIFIKWHSSTKSVLFP